MLLIFFFFFVFFFQAEDGIRDKTGVQTCALPICRRLLEAMIQRAADDPTYCAVPALLADDDRVTIDRKSVV